MIRKIICGVINTLSVLVIAAAIVILCMVLFTEPGKPPNIFGFTMLRITTGSMEPTYATDTLLVVKKTDPKEIMEGDVISFRGHGRVILQQVGGVTKKNRIHIQLLCTK